MSMHCTACGAEIKDNGKFCTSCGTPVAQAAPQAAPQYQAPQPPKAPESKFDGGVGETFGVCIIAGLIMTLTCFIGTPWAYCYMLKYLISHIIIDGRRLSFDGKGGQFFGKLLLWGLLTVITCGIYSFWMIPKMYNWIASHTHFAD